MGVDACCGGHVNRARWKLSASAILAAAVVSTGGVARADDPQHDRIHGTAPIKGLVTSVSNASMPVHTSGGSVTVGLSSSTTVTRLVMGSTADLAKGQQVDAQLTSPGRAGIKSIHIQIPPRGGVGKGDSGHAAGTRSGPVRVDTDRSNPRPSSPPSAVSGQIVSVGTNSISIRSGHGTMTYGLAGTLTVTKTLPGRLSDLAVGETVFAWVSRASGGASAVTILSS